MAKYIEREAAKRELISDYAYAAADLLDRVPDADVAPVVPELRKVVDLLNEEYEKAMQNTFINNPLAYALYQVWKAVDGTRNGR